MNSERSPITGRLLDRRQSTMEHGRYSVASNYSMGSMDLTYRDYFGPPNYTPFDESMIELDFIKTRTKSHIKRINSLRFKYLDWFDRKSKSFLDGIKLTQILANKLVPTDIENIKGFKQVYDMSRKFPRNGTPRDMNPARMEEFYMFWLTMVDLKEETDDLYLSLCRYCDSVTRTREPAIKREIDRLKVILDESYSDEFVFTDVNNEKDNLFTYRIGTFDRTYHGLLGYIPYLMLSSVRLLAWFGKVHLEKE